MVARINGAIIAAGRGERLRSGAHGLPKPLVEVAGEPLLARQARMLAAAGASPIHAIVNTETAALICARRIELPSDLRLIVRDTPNSLASLLALGDAIAPGRCLMATVDAVARPAEFERFAQRGCALLDSEATPALDGALAVVPWRGDERPLFAEVGPDGIIESLGERQTAWVTAGLYLFNTRIFSFAELARAHGLDAMRRYWALLIASGVRLAGIALKDVIDVDQAEDLAAARAMLANRSGVL